MRLPAASLTSGAKLPQSMLSHADELTPSSSSPDVPPYEPAERLNTWPHSSAARGERLIAAGRVVLSIFALLTIWLDPREPSKHADLTYLLLAGYALYSTALLLIVWTSEAAIKPLRVLTHGLDLSLYMVFIYLTEGTTSPFFAYLVFSVLCGAIRWRWRGALITATAAIGGYIGVGVYAEHVLKDPAFELDGFIFRAIYLAVIAGILAYVGAYEQQVRQEITRLAEWPRLVPADTGELVQQLLGHAAHVVAAPRVLMVWEGPEEPWRYAALWTASQFRLHRGAPDRYSPVVADVLEPVPFMTRDASGAGRVLFATASGLREWRGRAIHPDLTADFHMRSTFAVPLPGERLSGWLFYLDKPRPSYDDITVGTISAREIIASLDHAELLALQRESAVTDERTRLGRDLHDGLLQSLTAARLQLHQLTRQASDAGAQATEKLQALESAMSANQRELRMLVDQLRPGQPTKRQTHDLAEALEDLRARMRRDWDLDVRVELMKGVTIRGERARDVSLMVHEALVNAARHGHATTVDVRIAEDDRSLKICITDNGCGFPFRGRRDHLQLAQEDIGPVSLRERVVTLDGTLVIDSTSTGSRIDLAIPNGQSA